MCTRLASVVIPATATHTHTVVWLHGLGADGHDFAGIVNELALEQAGHVRFVLPHAPPRPVTINGGQTLRAWYDIADWSLHQRVDVAGITASATLVHELLAAEQALGIASTRIVLGGFSQGAVMALHAGLGHRWPLAGIVGLSGYLPTLAELRAQDTRANQRTPVLLAHGIIDPVVPVEAGKAALRDLENLGHTVRWRDYVLEHAVCAEELDDISAFINEVFGGGRPLG